MGKSEFSHPLSRLQCHLYDLSMTHFTILRPVFVILLKCPGAIQATES